MGEAIMNGADLLSEEERQRTRIVLCGNGDLDARIRERAAGNPAIVHGGWRSRPELVALMDVASAGILPYPNSRDFLVTFPNKVGEYLTAGLPILTGNTGAVRDLLEPRGLWLPYSAGSPASFVSALRDLAGRKDLAAMRARAKAVAKEEFDPGAIYPAFADWLEQVGSKERGVS